MRVLAFDTCLDACSVALWDTAGGAMHARIETMRQGHAERLCPMIEAVLAEAAIELLAVDAIAVTVGPGTFTGIRIGIAAARGLALATGAKVLGATSLALLAATARAELGATAAARPFAACQDARKGEVLLEIVGAERIAGIDRVRLLSPAAAAAEIVATAPDAVLVGSAASLVAEAAAASGTRLDLHPRPDLAPHARHLREMPLVPLATPTPLYPRPPDARPQPGTSLSRTP